jgi:light-regulated signal transduction histidine kinase (bacteriophytochrome)
VNTQHDLAAEVARLQAELAQARAELQDFVYTVSHDLRAPLRHIFSFAQIIAEDLVDIPPDIAEHLATIRQSAQLMTQQLDGLVSLSRLARAEVHLVALDAADLIQPLVDNCVQKYPERVLQWHIAPGMPKLLADADMLRQVFTHLLDNACKFTRTRSPASVTVSWQLLPSGACQITVQDNGVGFNPAQAERLFKVFSKLHSTRDYEGLGLGLVHCRKLLERMGGSISAVGAVDVGCGVTVTLLVAS